MRTLGLVLAVLLAAACSTAPSVVPGTPEGALPEGEAPSAQADDLDPVERAEADGVARARKRIASGEPLILFIGKPAWTSGDIDEDTGLPSDSAGCIYSDESAAYVDAHNDTIRDALDDGLLEGLHLKHKVVEHDDLIERFEDGEGTLIDAARPTLDANDGPYRIVRSEGSTGTPRYRIVDRRDDTEFKLTFLFETDPMLVIFDHGGTTLIAHAGPVYQVFDLPSRRFLQGFDMGKRYDHDMTRHRR